MIVGLTQKGKGENEALSGRTLRGGIKGVQSRRRQKGEVGGVLVHEARIWSGVRRERRGKRGRE